MEMVRLAGGFEHRQPKIAIGVDTPPSLRHQRHIEKAVDTMLIFNADSVISVYEDLNVCYQYTEGGLKPVVPDRRLRLERDALYRENGAIYLCRRSVIDQGKILLPTTAILSESKV